MVRSDPLTAALGRPNREQVVATRASAATTLQALELANGSSLDSLVKRGAEQLLAAGPRSTDALVRELYLRALGRAPNAVEASASRELAGLPPKQEGVEDLLWSLLMLPEFQLIY